MLTTEGYYDSRYVTKVYNQNEIVPSVIYEVGILWDWRLMEIDVVEIKPKLKFTLAHYGVWGRSLEDEI